MSCWEHEINTIFCQYYVMFCNFPRFSETGSWVWPLNGLVFVNKIIEKIGVENNKNMRNDIKYVFDFNTNETIQDTSRTLEEGGKKEASWRAFSQVCPWRLIRVGDRIFWNGKFKQEPNENEFFFIPTEKIESVCENGFQNTPLN